MPKEHGSASDRTRRRCVRLGEVFTLPILEHHIKGNRRNASCRESGHGTVPVGRMRASYHMDWSNTPEPHEDHRPPIVRTHRSDGRPDEVLKQPRLEQRKTDHLRYARYRESGDGTMVPGEVRASRRRYWSTPPKGNIRNTSRRESGHGANFADVMRFSYTEIGAIRRGNQRDTCIREPGPGTVAVCRMRVSGRRDCSNTQGTCGGTCP